MWKNGNYGNNNNTISCGKIFHIHKYKHKRINIKKAMSGVLH